MNHVVTPKERLELIPFEPVRTSSNLNWNGVLLEDYKYLPPSDLKLPSLDHHIIAFHYKPPPGRLKHASGEKSQSAVLQQNDITYVPALRENTWQFGYGQPHCLHILLSNDFVHRIALENFGVDASGLEFKTQFQTRDSHLQHLSQILQTELHQQGPNGALFAETTCTALAVHLLQNYSTLSSKQKLASSAERKNHGLNQQQLKQSFDFMHEHLDSKISLQDMAQQLNLSRFYFAKQFRLSTGKSPYQYFKELRLEKAHQLLQSNSTITITKIAYKFGFADQSHFTKQFRTHFGYTPSECRNTNYRD